MVVPSVSGINLKASVGGFFLIYIKGSTLKGMPDTKAIGNHEQI